MAPRWSDHPLLSRCVIPCVSMLFLGVWAISVQGTLYGPTASSQEAMLSFINGREVLWALAPPDEAASFSKNLLFPSYMSSPERRFARLVARPSRTLHIRFDGLPLTAAQTYALNPTGGAVRASGMDPWGSGEYGASRFSHAQRARYPHRGIDYVGHLGQAVVAPLSGQLKRRGLGATTGVDIVGHVNGRKYKFLLLHFTPYVTDGFVRQGQPIGYVKSLDRWYPRMTPHVHVEVFRYEANGRTQKRVDPASVIPKA